MISRDFLLREIEKHEKSIIEIKSKLTRKPEGWIRTRTYPSGKKSICYCKHSKNNTISRSVLDMNNPSDVLKEEKIRNYHFSYNQIENKKEYVKYLKLLLKTVDNITKKEKKTFKSYSFFEDDVLENIMPKDQTVNDEWNKIKGRQNDLYLENLKYKGVGGFYRSKSEAAISQELFRNDIKFKYEIEISNGQTKIYPDFILLSPLSQTYVIWEHFGKIDDSEYRNKTLRKIEFYASLGYYLNRNLILTYETYEQPFTESNIKNIIEMIRYM